MSFEINAIQLTTITDNAGRAINVFVDHKDGKAIVLFVEKSGRKSDYRLSTILGHAICQDGNFEITDGFDGTQNTRISAFEINEIARQALTILPRFLGEFVVSVDYVPNDPTLPF